MAAAEVRKRVCYFAGREPVLPIDVQGVRVADTSPEQWTVVTAICTRNSKTAN